jgi:hypothetical protein
MPRGCGDYEGDEMRAFDLLGKWYEQCERLCLDGDGEGGGVDFVSDATSRARDAICDAISALTPETEWERNIYIRVIQFHRENLNRDALRRMYLTLSRTVPARAAEYHECLDAYVFFSNVTEHDDERDEALDRLHEVLTDRLAA